MYFYSPKTQGFYTREINGENIPAHAVEITWNEYRALLDGQSAGKIIGVDADGRPVLQEPPPPPPPDPKMVGVEFEGVMCSATRDDQNGIAAVWLAYQLAGENFVPTEFRFVNGNSLVLTVANIRAFIGTWMPFRQQFFRTAD